MTTEIQWQSGATGSWFTAANWVPNLVPATGDTAIIDSGIVQILSPASPVVGINIMLGGLVGDPPAILEAVDAVFEGTSGTPEVNMTLTVSGLGAETNAVFVAEGDTSFDGQIFVEAIAGSLTILVRDDGSNTSVFRLLNSDQKAAIVVSQESFLDFEGQTVVNESLIQIEGAVEISTGVRFTGADGVFLLENGGQLLVEGNVANTQQIVFVDGTGKLTIDNLAGFHGVIEYAELPPQPGQPPLGIAGGRVELTQVAAQSLAFFAGSGDTGTLKLYAGPNETGGVIAELTMGMVSDVATPAKLTLTSADFSLNSNGSGGTVISYAPQGSTFLLSSLPTPVIAEAGEVVSFKSLLKDSFGKLDTPFKGAWLFPSTPFENTSTNVGYWNPPNDPDPQYVTPQWYVRGKPVETATFVKDLSKVTLQVGNQIDSPASFQLRVTDAKSGTDAGYITYNVWTVDPAVIQAMQIAGFVPGTVFTPEMVVKAAEAFAHVYGSGDIPNTNLCDWIADNVAAGAGATMPFPNASFDPSLNVEGGFWRIFYASDIPNPVQDWSSLVQPGDIVRMGWFKPEKGRVSGHSTTALSTVVNGEIKFYDNNDSQHIGIHDAAYWLNTDPDDITIFRLDPNQQYLIQGTSLSDVIWGSVHNNLIRPGGGADTIKLVTGNNEIEGTAAQLDGIAVGGFTPGDSFHVTDLDLQSTSVTHHHGRLQVFDDGNEVASIKMPGPGHGFAFFVTSDPDGGVSVALVARQQVAVADDPNGALAQGSPEAFAGQAGPNSVSYANATTAVVADLLNPARNTGFASGDTYKSIENLTGSAFADTLTGNAASNALDGDAGNDTLAGNAGIDTLTGGLGADCFAFLATKDGGDTTGDIIIDFVSGEDHIGVLRSGFKIATTVDLGAGGANDFAARYFVSSVGAPPSAANPSGVVASESGHGQFLFNQTTDQLWWDLDGTGAGTAVLLATFQNGAHVLASDFDLV